MAGFTVPVSRASGRAIVVGNAASRAFPLAVLGRLGYQALEVDDPYTAMSELAQRPLAYRAMALCLGGLYREELQIIAAAKRRFPNIEIWLAQVDGRAAALAEASRLGADGLISEEGLHRFATSSPVVQEVVPPPSAPPPPDRPPEKTEEAPAIPDSNPTPAAPLDPLNFEPSENDPVLTADELRALLQEQPSRGTEGEEA